MDPSGPTRARLAWRSPDAMALGAFLVLTAGFFLFFGLQHLTLYEDDIENYYYPALLYLAQSLREGTLPLWTPAMLAGFPFIADGSPGILYPLNWLAVVLPAESLVLWMVALRTAIGGALFYAFARVVRVKPGGALLAAIAYAFSGYSVGHWIHFNVGHSALTLPLALLAVELAARTTGRRAWLWLIVAGVASGLMWLGVHPQIALIGSTGVGAFGLFRTLWPDESAPWRQRLARFGVGTLVVGAITAGLAAAQLLPMGELGGFSERGNGVPYSFATSFALPPHNLLTLIWPHLFISPMNFDWGLSSRWETAFYVGQAPLLLALLMLGTRRNRTTLFWGLLAGISLWIGLGEYSVLNLHQFLYHLPGFSVFRVPARFVQLTDVALAVLAGQAFDLIASGETSERLRRWARRLAIGLIVVVAIVCLLAVAIAYFPDVVQKGQWLAYLNWQRSSLWKDNDFWLALQLTVNAQNGRWLWWSIFGVVTAGLFWGWQRRPGPRWAWAMAAFATVELLIAAGTFWAWAPFDVLQGDRGVVPSYVVEHAGDQRVLTYADPIGPTQPNRLFEYGVREVNAYGPLRPQRFVEYMAVLQRGDNRLLDLLGVRWIVAPRPDRLPRQVMGVGFDPRHPIVVGAQGAKSGETAYSVDPGFATSSVRLVGYLSQAAQVPQGRVVAELTLRSSDGRSVALPIQAGVHLAENAARRADVQPILQHSLPPTAFQEPVSDVRGKRYQRQMYIGDVAVPDEPFQVTQWALRVTEPMIGVEIYGLTLLGPDGSRQVGYLSQSSIQERVRDESARVLNNTAAAPRVFLVSSVRTTPANSSALYTMTRELTDPTATVFMEEPFDTAVLSGTGPSGQAQLVAETPARLTINVEAERPALLVVTDLYYPGWRATVDGTPAHVYRADYIFRAVQVPAGKHVVTMEFESDTVRTGFIISGVTLLVLICAAVVLLWSHLAIRRLRYAADPSRERRNLA